MTTTAPRDTALLVVGFLCNLFITAVNERHHMVPDESDAMGMAD